VVRSMKAVRQMKGSGLDGEVQVKMSEVPNKHESLLASDMVTLLLGYGYSY